MVVRFHLEANVVLVVEPHHPGIVREHAHEPIEVQILGRLENRFFQQVVDDLSLESDLALQSLVRAMFAPRLRDGLELAVGRVSSQVAKVRLDRFHLLEAERKLPLAAGA